MIAFRPEFDLWAEIMTPNDKIIRLPQVKEMVGFGTTTVYDMMKKGEFPKQIKLGRMSGWLESEITAWIEGKAQQRFEEK